MKINPINNVNYSNRKVKRTQVQSPSFNGDKGRAIGSILGAAGALAGVTALSAIGIGVPLLPLVAAGITAKAGGDAGDRYEEDLNKNKKK